MEICLHINWYLILKAMIIAMIFLETIPTFWQTTTIIIIAIIISPLILERTMFHMMSKTTHMSLFLETTTTITSQMIPKITLMIIFGMSSGCARNQWYFSTRTILGNDCFILITRQKLGGRLFFVLFLDLTDTGENVQKWTRVFSTRRWVILVARTRRKKGEENTRVQFDANSPVDKFRVLACIG